MNILRVWAPNAKRVAALIGQRRLDMEKQGGEANGWWQVRAHELVSGADYAFFVDNDEKPTPDPRSRFQPHGVHGVSRVVDDRTFAWTDERFEAPALSDAVIYELHVGTFTPGGTFDSAIERIDHLVELGITHAELMPVAEFSGARGWGYDGVELFAPHHAYGGPEALKRLVNACHARGLAVILDVVYNHFGPSGNYLPQYGPYLTTRYKTPWGSAVNLDGRGSDEVRRFFCDNAISWMRDYHVDGLRLDAVHAIMDTSPRHFLEQLAEETAELARHTQRRLVLIAEDDLNDPRVVTSADRGGYGLDAQWAEDFHHSLHTVLTGEQSGYYSDFGKLEQLAKTLRRAFAYDGQYSVYRDRRHGKSAAGLSGHNFIGCLQNHDQIGNRAKGDRISHLISTARVRIGAAVVLLGPFIPLLFQGEEWAASTPFQYFTDHQEADLADAVSEGRKNEFAAFGWHPEDIPDPQESTTFQRSKLDWTEAAREPHKSILDWYKQLIRLRTNTRELRDGRFNEVDVDYDEQQRWLMISRGPITMALNLGEQKCRLPIPVSGSLRLLMASDDKIILDRESVELPSDSVVVIARG
ncbi:MAG: malto-oligosyltrehalose trehalohydrolase [Deltaproteobacteria bacterium]|nr:malto-oligosyltrehalose trehalohydrolase [Deltaproteobacteria bacterium]